MAIEEYQKEFGFPEAVSKATTDVRARFIQKTYLHLAGAILAFIGIESVLVNLPIAESMAIWMSTGWNWLIMIGVFMVASHFADKWARSSTSMAIQYVGLAVYTGIWSLICMPALYYASTFEQFDGVIAQAGVITLALFGAITLIAFTTKKDFSFLGSILKISFFVAIGAIVASVIFGFTLGILFSAAMVLVAAGSILYSTSNIIHHYREDQHVAASLALFAGIALLFMYVLRILMILANDR